MKYLIKNPVSIALCFIFFAGALAGCRSVEEYIIPKKEYIAYDEIKYNVVHPVNIEIIGQTGNIEIYSWDEKAVKFEIAKKVRLADESLGDKLTKNIKIITNCENEKDIILEWKCEGQEGSILDYQVDLKVLLPKKVESIKCKIDVGKVRIFDDLKCELFADFNMVNIKINKFEGTLKLKGEMSNLEINEGTIKNGSEVKVNMGNIKIKANYEAGGSYYLETNVGNIDLTLPSDLAVSFENNGYVQVNEFEPGNHPVKIKTACGMGRICIYKY
ncbi:MAG: hypothetical protein GX754_12380 [Clostridiaceae bacterium]|nr:hypothetical protein [Clostridiaceae bacterium]